MLLAALRAAFGTVHSTKATLCVRMMDKSLRRVGVLLMTRRFSLAVAVTAIATWVLFPGLAAAQEASPVAVLPQVIEQPQVLAETLPRTGSNVIPMLVVALALVAIGAVLVISARRRNAGDVTPA